MCWNLQVSMASACFGWATCLYLWKRQRSDRDSWYALYLLTFTFTQIVDAFLWKMNDTTELQACKAYQLQFFNAPTNDQEYTNFLVSKYIIPLIVFSQHAVQLTYPSKEYKSNPEKQKIIIIGHAIPCIIMSFCFACTMLTESKFPYEDKTLFWGGDFSDYPFSLIQFGATLHSGLVAFGFYYFCNMRGKVLYAHLIPLGCVVSFLWITEQRMDFGSKWCTYCLIYSFVYICEPWWYPDSKDERNVTSSTKSIRSRANRSKSAERKKTPSKKTPSKKTPSKKTPSKKTPSKKTPSKKTPSKKTPSKSTPSKKTPSKKSTPKEKKTPAKNRTKTPVRKKNARVTIRQRKKELMQKTPAHKRLSSSIEESY
jgi:hypothetical protein